MNNNRLKELSMNNYYQFREALNKWDASVAYDGEYLNLSDFIYSLRGTKRGYDRGDMYGYERHGIRIEYPLTPNHNACSVIYVQVEPPTGTKYIRLYQVPEEARAYVDKMIVEVYESIWCDMHECIMLFEEQADKERAEKKAQDEMMVKFWKAYSLCM